MVKLQSPLSAIEMDEMVKDVLNDLIKSIDRKIEDTDPAKKTIRRIILFKTIHEIVALMKSDDVNSLSTLVR